MAKSPTIFIRRVPLDCMVRLASLEKGVESPRQTPTAHQQGEVASRSPVRSPGRQPGLKIYTRKRPLVYRLVEINLLCGDTWKTIKAILGRRKILHT